jgi:hypothetical protein
VGIFSSTVSITRYRIQGHLPSPVMEAVAGGLKKHAISEIDNDTNEKSVGWTSMHQPYSPDFSGASFIYGEYLVFSLRIDRKSIPSKLIKKHEMIETARRLQDSGRNFLSRQEKETVRDQVESRLARRIPATPNVYDIVWNYEKETLWFFTNLKTANEELETLFARAFKLTLIRLFPYTSAELTSNLSDREKDTLAALKPDKIVA